jgi:integrase/recombinase XerC
VPKLSKRDWSHYSLLQSPPTDADVRRLLSAHLASLRVPFSASTVRRAERCCLYWVLWCEARGLDVRRAGPEDAAAVTEQWRGPHGWAETTLRHFICHCRAWGEWLVDSGHAPGNPWRRIRAPRATKHLPRVLSPEEIARMAAALEHPHWRDIRDRAILLVLWSTGCRVSELIGLDMTDIDLGAGTALVLGKGRKERTVYLLPPAIAALRLYLRAVRPLLCEGTAGPVWVGRHGRRLNATIVRDALIRAAQHAGIERHVHPHMLRHSCATALKRGGADLQTVAGILGHEDIGTTQMYVHLDDADLAEAHRRFHPLAAAEAAAAVGR